MLPGNPREEARVLCCDNAASSDEHVLRRADNVCDGHVEVHAEVFAEALVVGCVINQALELQSLVDCDGRGDRVQEVGDEVFNELGDNEAHERLKVLHGVEDTDELVVDRIEANRGITGCRITQCVKADSVSPAAT